MKIQSDFAILDVKRGRRNLAQRFQSDLDTRIPVTITGYIDGIHSRDDGESQEFCVAVEGISVREEPA